MKFILSEKGQSAVIVLLSLIGLLATTGLVVDGGRAMVYHRKAQNAADAAALAAAQALSNGAPDSEILNQIEYYAITINGATSYTATYQPAGVSVGNGVVPSNVEAIVVETAINQPTILAGIIGFDEISVSAQSAGCPAGVCGGGPVIPADIMLVLDRTHSMTLNDLNNVKNAAKAILEYFNPEKQHVGLVVLNAANPNNHCAGKGAEYGGTWLVVPLSNDYQNADGSLNTSSQLVSTINCLPQYSRTNLGSPIKDLAFGRPDAITELLTNGRPNVKKGIILMSDGAANEPDSVPGYPQYTGNPCRYALDMAQAAKDAGIEIYTIGFGIEDEVCRDYVAPWNGTGYSGDQDVRDEFNAVSYCNNDGSANWSTCWDGYDPYGGGASGGLVRVHNGELRFGNNHPRNHPYEYRKANLSGATSAYLSFDYRTSGNLEHNDRFGVYVKKYWYHQWTRLEQFSNDVSGSATYDISNFISPYTRIMFRIDNRYSGNNEYFYVDNVTISYSLAPGSGGGSNGVGRVTEFLAEMATNSQDDQGHCLTESAKDAENTDGDHFLCETKPNDLEPVFRQAAESMTGGAMIRRWP